MRKLQTLAKRRTLLHDNAAPLLKKIIEKHPKSPAAAEAEKLLKEIDSAE